MTEYEYEYYSAFPKWPNTNTNTSIRPQLFEYYSNTYVETHAHTHAHTHANAHIHSILHSCNWQPTELCHSWPGTMVLQNLFEEEELEEEDSDVDSDAYEGDESESDDDED